ncbi:MAG TPA: hypothetical protein VI758_11980 [Bacteroidota bacterium]
MNSEATLILATTIKASAPSAISTLVGIQTHTVIVGRALSVRWVYRDRGGNRVIRQFGNERLGELV